MGSGQEDERQGERVIKMGQWAEKMGSMGGDQGEGRGEG